MGRRAGCKVSSCHPLELWLLGRSPRYNAVGTGHLLDLMRGAGFTATERLDGRFYQPVLVGHREA